MRGVKSCFDADAQSRFTLCSVFVVNLTYDDELPPDKHLCRKRQRWYASPARLLDHEDVIHQQKTSLLSHCGAGLRRVGRDESSGMRLLGTEVRVWQGTVSHDQIRLERELPTSTSFLHRSSSSSYKL